MIVFEDDGPADPLGVGAEVALPLPKISESVPRAMRPREKLRARGAAHLSRTELLALVLGTGSRKGSALRTADRLLRRHGLRGLATLDVAGYLSEKGVGAAVAARLVATFELGRRSSGMDREDRPRLASPTDVFRHVSDLGRAKKEHLVGLYLDAQNGLIVRETISVGSLNTTRTHPREILFPAIEHLAMGFILVHNHPSGCLDPSDEDVAFTRAVQRAGELMGIELYDHVIVARRGFISLRERGVL
jgi:DNA repair protein RadC